MKIRSYVWNFPLYYPYIIIRNIQISLTVTKFVISFLASYLTKVCLISDIFLFPYHSEAAIESVPQIPQNKRLLANTNFDKIFGKCLTESSFLINLQTLFDKGVKPFRLPSSAGLVQGYKTSPHEQIFSIINNKKVL